MIKFAFFTFASIFVASSVAAQDTKQPILRTDVGFCQAFASAIHRNAAQNSLRAALGEAIAGGYGKHLTDSIGSAALPNDLTDLPYNTLNDLVVWADQCAANLKTVQGIAQVYFQSVPTTLKNTIQSKQQKEQASRTQAKEREDFAACEQAAKRFSEHNFELLPTLQASFPNVNALDQMSISNYKSLFDWTNNCYGRFYNQLGVDGHNAMRSYANALSQALATLKNSASKLPQCSSSEIIALYKKSITDGPLGKQGLSILDMNNVTTLGTSDDLNTKACQAQLFTNAGKMVSNFTIEFVNGKQIYLDVKSLDRAP